MSASADPTPGDAVSRGPGGGVTLAIVVAMLALVVSLSGGVYAAVKIDGKDIEKGSIAGKKLKTDGVTGKQVKESSLGTVPRASTLAGVGPGGFVPSGDRRRVKFAETRTTADITKPLLSLGTLRLSAECEGTNYAVKASTTASGASYDVSSVFSHGGSGSTSSVSGGGLSPNPDEVMDSGTVSVGEYHREVGTLVYNSDPAGETISVDLAVYVSRTAGSTFCYVAGTAERMTR